MRPPTNPMLNATPVQLDLMAPGCPSALDEAWAAHRRQLSPLSLTQALADPIWGRLLRAHATSIEAMRRRAARRRLRRVRR